MWNIAVTMYKKMTGRNARKNFFKFSLLINSSPSKDIIVSHFISHRIFHLGHHVSEQSLGLEKFN